MAGKVKPVNVAPLIRVGRYGFLILGYFYGSLRLSALKLYEKKAKELRHKMLHEREEMEKERAKMDGIRELTSMAREFEITEFTPGWEDEI